MLKNIDTSHANKNISIVFMGTAEFAVPPLHRVLQAGYNVVGVVTAPDKPAGRGMELRESPVKKFALAHDLTILQPVKLRDPGFLDALGSLKADLQVVVAFRMLPEVVWNMPPMGTINLHGSLLPQYRGAAPINWAIINGETETGVTTFKLQHEIDTGNILLTEKIAIGEEETAGELHDRMKHIGADLLVRTIDGLTNKNLKEISQVELSFPNEESSSELKHAPKIFTETSKINWARNIDDIYNLIRGLSPQPGAFTLLKDKILKIHKAAKEETDPRSNPGEFETDKRSYLKFAAKNGYISVKELQLEGKKRIFIEEFLRGYRF